MLCSAQSKSTYQRSHFGSYQSAMLSILFVLIGLSLFLATNLRVVRNKLLFYCLFVLQRAAPVDQFIMQAVNNHEQREADMFCNFICCHGTGSYLAHHPMLGFYSSSSKFNACKFRLFLFCCSVETITKETQMVLNVLIY